MAGARAGAAEHGPEGAAPQAYGSAESDYRPERWGGFREDYRFTGKEEDVEVGLTYFGARYLSTALGRWVSADPLTVHGAGADLNGYAYVHGSVLKNVDPLGLDETDPEKADVPYDRDSEEFGYAYENEQAGSIDEVMSDKNLNVEIVRHPVADITFGADTIKIRPDAPVDVGRSIPKAAPIQESPKIDLQSSAVMRVLAIGNPALKLGVGAAEDFLNAPARAIDAGQHFARAGVLWSDATTSIDKAEALEAGLHGIKGITDAVSGLGTPFIAIGSIAKNAAKGGETAMRGCFVADTPVLTKDGYKPIAEVEAGDWVWSFDSESGAWEWNEVTQKLVHEHSGPMVVLQSGEDQILATPNHPVCLHSGAELGTRPVPLDIGEDSIRCGNSGRWVEAGQIQQGDVALGSRGQSHVDSTAVGDQSRLVYNLKVAGAHSYVVGKSQLLVHNKGAEWIPKVLQRGGNTINKGTAKALNEYADMNLHSRDWGRALEALKKDLELGNAHHGVILENGNYADSAGKVLGSILDYLPGGR